MDAWLSDTDYQIWLSKVNDDDPVTRCGLCRSGIKLSTVAQSALNLMIMLAGKNICEVSRE